MYSTVSLLVLVCWGCTGLSNCRHEKRMKICALIYARYARGSCQSMRQLCHSTALYAISNCFPQTNPLRTSNRYHWTTCSNVAVNVCNLYYTPTRLSVSPVHFESWGLGVLGLLAGEVDYDKIMNRIKSTINVLVQRTSTSHCAPRCDNGQYGNSTKYVQNTRMCEKHGCVKSPKRVWAKSRSMHKMRKTN